MKTGNILSIAALIICCMVCVNSVNAQTPSDQVTVNIKFKPVQTIMVNAMQKNIDLLYSTAADYANGVTSGVQAKHLKVYSAGGFVVSVKPNQDFTRGADGGTIPAKDVLIIASKPDGTSEGNIVNSAGVPLNKDKAETLISSNKGGIALEYDIEYNNVAAGDNNEYFGKYIAADDKGTGSVYTATVTYSIAPN